MARCLAKPCPWTVPQPGHGPSSKPDRLEHHNSGMQGTGRGNGRCGKHTSVCARAHALVYVGARARSSLCVKTRDFNHAQIERRNPCFLQGPHNFMCSETGIAALKSPPKHNMHARTQARARTHTRTHSGGGSPHGKACSCVLCACGCACGRACARVTHRSESETTHVK